MTFQQWLDDNFFVLCQLYREFLDEMGEPEIKTNSPVAGFLNFAHGLFLETEHSR